MCSTVVLLCLALWTLPACWHDVAQAGYLSIIQRSALYIRRGTWVARLLLSHACVTHRVALRQHPFPLPKDLGVAGAINLQATGTCARSCGHHELLDSCRLCCK
ncbi:hypothetical protein OH77DRAFT_1061809 [Trametes cingulata]|nr:hypothetical protein OH77DRAFT_1061809 [Trametes cingulata]